MKIGVRFDLYDRQGPDPWDDSWGILLPLDHIICRDVDGTPHTIREFIWPWQAYTKNQRRCTFHFYYWNEKVGPHRLDRLEVSPEREARIRELQFLMTRQLYFGTENASRTLKTKIRALYCLARFAEKRSCTIRDVLTNSALLDACGINVPNSLVMPWMTWINFLRQLDPTTQLGFTLSIPKKWKDLERRVKNIRNNSRQHAPLPTRIYAGLINNLSSELKDIEAHAPRLLRALREALVEYAHAKSIQICNNVSVGPALIKKHGLGDYLVRRGFNIKNRALYSLSGAVTEIFQVCKLQIHVFSGMRDEEARTLPYHCIVTKKGAYGRTHSLVAGVTTKFNKGRRLRTHWVTTDREGFRAIRLAQQFAGVIYESLGVSPSKADSHKDGFPLFPSSDYLPWGGTDRALGERTQTSNQKLFVSKSELCARLLPVLEEEDVRELEGIDPFRAWRDESEFTIGQRWPLTTHQLRRSLVVYANASGLVRLSSLRRQLQHITLEMSLYYGRGSMFCKNFIANDPDGYKKHVAPEWQDGDEEAEVLTFTRDVLNSSEPMFGGAGNFYQNQIIRGDVMSRETVASRMKAGLLSYQPGPLGGCTKPGGCDKRKGIAMLDISCATGNCMNLVGKHSKVIRLIQLKRAAMAHTTQGSIEYEMEREDLEALDLLEHKWRPQTLLSAPQTGEAHA
jgi:hypothetical protein